MLTRRKIIKGVVAATVFASYKAKAEELTYGPYKLNTQGRHLVMDLYPYVEAGRVRRVFLGGKIKADLSAQNGDMVFYLGYRRGSTVQEAVARLTSEEIPLSPYSLYKATIIANEDVARVKIEEQNTLAIYGSGFGALGAMATYFYLKLTKRL